MKRITLQLVFLVLLASCQRQPTANFTTDKTEYQAGDTVHLKNTSEHGKHYIWTMPDGSTQTTTDATYIIPDTTLYSNFTFKLEALSRREKKTNSYSKNILATIKPKLSGNSFKIDNNLFVYGYPSIVDSADKTIIYAYDIEYGTIFRITIILPFNISNINSGAYMLQKNLSPNNINSTHVIYGSKPQDCDGIPHCSFYSDTCYGNIVVINKMGKIQVLFNNIQSKIGRKISGNIITK